MVAEGVRGLTVDAIAIATVVTAIGTLILAAVTAYLAWQTRDMASQNREMVAANREMLHVNTATLEEIRSEREERERPRVIVYVDYEHLPMLYIVVENVGGSSAARVRFSFRSSGSALTRSVKSRYGDEQFNLLQELRMFKGGYGIRLLPAGEKLSIWWGHAGDVVQHFRYNDPGIEVAVYYSSRTKEDYPVEDKDYREDFILNPVDVWKANRTAITLRPSLHEIVYPLIQAAEKIGKAVDGYGNVKIKTATERAREQAARRRELRRMLKRGAEAYRGTEASREDRGGSDSLEPPRAPQTAADASEGTEPWPATGGAQEATERAEAGAGEASPWWRRVFGGRRGPDEGGL